jgi:hypothetical protein
MVERLPIKHEVQSSNPSAAKEKEKKERERIPYRKEFLWLK